jgi:MoaA/NifB/PqqE/SkfB family radical SAM enzyme
MEARELFDTRVIDFFKAAVAAPSHGRLRDYPRRLYRLLAALSFQRRQAKKRAAAAREGRTVPPLLIASVTRRCNLDCAGCYAKQLRPMGAAPELGDERFMEIFREAIGMGVGTIMIAGGEPLLRRSLLESASRLPGILLPVITNGTLIDSSTMELFSSGALVPVFSIEGESTDTDGRRGGGIHEAVVAKARTLRDRGALFGFSITLTSRNTATVLSDEFLGRLSELGPAVVFMIEYVPAVPGTEGLVLEAGQKASLNEAGRFAQLPFQVVLLPGDEESYGGCLAAGRGFIHLASDGRIEACPFAPFSDSDTEKAGLAAALDSPLMRAIRQNHAELTETKGGCALWNKRGWIASLGACTSASTPAPTAALEPVPPRLSAARAVEYAGD